MRKINKLVVFGATGTQGHPVVDAALRAGLTVRAVARDSVKAEESLSTRAEFCPADLLDAASVRDAMGGMDAAFFFLPVLPQTAAAESMVEHVIAAARAVGLRRLIFTTSAWCSDSMPDGAFVNGLRLASQRLLSSGINTVVLRPTLYLANLVWPHVLSEVRQQGRLTYPPLDAGRRLNWTATEDQARLAVAALEAEVAGEIIDIASPGAVTGPDLCRHLAQVFGREVHYAPQTVEDFADTLSHMAGSAEVGHSVAALYEGINRLSGDGPLVDTAALEQRFGVRLTPVSEWVEQRLGALLERYGGTI
ncbi:MAG: NAD(P)H-binding protein [Wenzhouxiangella sp.]|nr:NAD(P)H-binding protein [Wenzhouxiangella sp.]